MPGLVTENDRLVTFDGRPVHQDLQAVIEAAGPTPAERTVRVEAESRVIRAGDGE